MSNTKHTVLGILQIVADIRGESSVDAGSKRIRLASRAEKDFARRTFWKIYSLEDQIVVGTGSNDYTIGSSTYPYRVKGLSEVFVSTTGSTSPTAEGNRHQIVDYNKYKNLYNQNNGTKMVYEWYDATNDLWKMHVNPAPEATETITYTHFWEPPTRTLSTDAIICPNPKIIALLVLADLADSEDEIQRSQIFKNEAEQLIAELVGLEKTPAVNQLYAMGAIENQTSPHGIGTY